MENLFPLLQKVLAQPGGSSSDKHMKLLYLNNPDGSIRWVWPSGSSKPYFLKFYHADTKRALAFQWLIQLVFIFRLQGMVFKHLEFRLPEGFSWKQTLNKTKWALFTGTKGPNSKAVLYTEHQGEKHFTKIPLGRNALQLVNTEFDNLQWLSRITFKKFEFPDSVWTDAELQLRSIGGNMSSSGFSAAHHEALAELHHRTKLQAYLKSHNSWQALQKGMESLDDQDTRIPRGIRIKWIEAAKSIDPNTQAVFSLAHGDFVPWNIKKGTEKLAILDWELAAHRPAGFDFFHFFVQKGVLIEHRSWKPIEASILAYHREHGIPGLEGLTIEEVKSYLLLYLLYQTAYYLPLYHAQSQWHLQIEWLINAWNEGLSSLFIADYSPRKLIILDLFDRLSFKQYAALRFNHHRPEALALQSDIDLCISKKDARSLLQALKVHPLVESLQVKSKHFMRASNLLLKTGEFLSLDLIWSFERKSLQYLNIREVLSSISTNSYGVKRPSPLFDARYTSLFYALNRSEVPSHYTQYATLLSRSEESLDALLELYTLGEISASRVVEEIQKQRRNHSLFKIFRNLFYMVDITRSLFQKRGFVISFSGVDGAGKSTILSHTKKHLEKTWRQRVVVLRHRPSVLPILSTWKYGKSEAEAKSMAQLPRQGANSSRISSLFRFAYYYLDYILGQVYVYLRYIVPGYVVLYDRFYFDMIHDSRRTNIQLNSHWIEKGLALIRIPEFNFYLYADPQTILERKQELDAQTIQDLNERYLNFFSSRDRGSHQFTAIQNVELNTTLQTIYKSIQQKVA